MKKIFIALNVDTEGPVTDETHSDLLNNWKAIDESLKKIFSDSFRQEFSDSSGEPVKFNWFIMDWAGFKTNPVKRDFGYHKIFDHYVENFGSSIKKFNDGIYWHYHHPPKSGIGNEWNPNWKQNREYENILCRAVIERNFFPAIFRAGGTIENNDASNWLEKWIPFDYSSRAKAK